jgi:NAD(P)-dependent dehydrogenase (short-subunit alcohol dehydrogenase family)
MNKKNVEELFDVTGKVALITGATGGFGKAAAKGLAAAGAKVMATGRATAKLEQLVKEIRDGGGQAAFSTGDPTKHEDVQRVIKDTVSTFGGIDILITAAGMNKVGMIVDQPLEEFENIMNANVKGTWLFCKEAGRVMIEQGRGGKVILLSSTRGLLGMARYGVYSPTKAAVNLLTKSLGCEWGPHKINVNAIAPTVFRTELTQWMFDDQGTYKNFLVRIPIGRLGEPEDFVGAVIFLSSKASDFMTGSIVYMDGGYTAG